MFAPASGQPRYDDRTMVTVPLPRARQPVPVALIALVFMLGLLAGCGDDDDTDPTAGKAGAQPDVITTPTKAIKQQARQFRWEQVDTYSGAKAAVAETAKYNLYFQSLRSREHDFVPADLAPFVDPKTWQDFTEPLDIGASMRGAHTVRILDVKVDGNRAYTISCIDQRHLEKQSAGTDSWEPADHQFTQENFQFTRSDRSPTGWVRHGHNYLGYDALPPANCSKNTFTKPAAVTDQGPFRFPAHE